MDKTPHSELEMEPGLSEMLENFFELSDSYDNRDDIASNINELGVLGGPKPGKRVTCAAGLDVFVPDGVVYWWHEGLTHFARPTEPPENYSAGIFTLPANFSRQWAWQVHTADIGKSDFATAADWRTMQEQNLADDEFSASSHKIEHAEQTLYILSRGWSEAARPDTETFFAAPAVFMLYHYQDGTVYSLTGRYSCYDGDCAMPPDMLDMLRSVAPGGCAPASADESALKKYGSLAGGAGNINGFKLLSLFRSHVLYFNPETDLAWNGSTHLAKGVSFHYIPANPAWQADTTIEASTIIDGVRHVIDTRSAPPDNGAALTEGTLALFTYLAQLGGLTIPRKCIHPNLLAVLPPHDFTTAALFTLINQHSLIIMGGGQDGDPNAYTVLLDINVKNGVPDVHNLIGRFIGALRHFNGLEGPFSVAFSNTRNLDSEISDIIDGPVEGAVKEGNITMAFGQSD